MSRATEWRQKAAEAARKEAVELELPSGMVILARRPTPGELAMWGGLPLSLAVAAREGSDGAALSDEDVVAAHEFMRTVLINAVVEPRISLTPGPEEIHPREIPGPDWQFIVNWATRAEEARNLESFRGERPDAGGRGDGESVLDQTF